MLRFISNADEQASKLMAFADDVTIALVEGMKKSLNEVGLISAQKYLQGPRPHHLDIGIGIEGKRGGGKLIRALTGAYSFSGGVKTTGSPAVSSKDGIREVKVIGNNIIGEMGLKTFEPFDYPKMWEETGHGPIVPKRAKALHFFTHDGNEVFTKHVRAQKARPFLAPAGDEAKSSGKLDLIMQGELNKATEKFN